MKLRDIAPIAEAITPTHIEFKTAKAASAIVAPIHPAVASLLRQRRDGELYLEALPDDEAILMQAIFRMIDSGARFAPSVATIQFINAVSAKTSELLANPSQEMLAGLA